MQRKCFCSRLSFFMINPRSFTLLNCVYNLINGIMYEYSKTNRIHLQIYIISKNKICTEGKENIIALHYEHRSINQTPKRFIVQKIMAFTVACRKYFYKRIASSIRGSQTHHGPPTHAG